MLLNTLLLYGSKQQRSCTHLLVAALVLLCTAPAFGAPPLFQNSMPPSWVLDKTVNNVEFYHMLTECNGKTVVLLKFNNRNSSAVNVTWTERFATQLETAREGASKKQLRLAPGETAASGCDDTRNKSLVIPAAQAVPIYPAEIRGFQYGDVRVSKG